MLFHAHLIEVIELELADTLNQDRELAAEEEILRLKIKVFVKASCGENVVADADVIDKDFLQRGGLVFVAEDFVLLERLEVVYVEVANGQGTVLVRLNNLLGGHFAFLSGRWGASSNWTSALCFLLFRVGHRSRLCSSDGFLSRYSLSGSGSDFSLSSSSSCFRLSFSSSRLSGLRLCWRLSLGGLRHWLLI